MKVKNNIQEGTTGSQQKREILHLPYHIIIKGLNSHEAECFLNPFLKLSLLCQLLLVEKYQIPTKPNGSQ